MSIRLKSCSHFRWYQKLFWNTHRVLFFLFTTLCWIFNASCSTWGSYFHWYNIIGLLSIVSSLMDIFHSPKSDRWNWSHDHAFFRWICCLLDQVNVAILGCSTPKLRSFASYYTSKWAQKQSIIAMKWGMTGMQSIYLTSARTHIILS
jgi:hypothetical protein